MRKRYAGVSIWGKSANIRLGDRRSITIDLYAANDKKLGTLLVGAAGIAWQDRWKHRRTTRTVPFEELVDCLG
jgi:hypothetical protein